MSYLHFDEPTLYLHLLEVGSHDYQIHRIEENPYTILQNRVGGKLAPADNKLDRIAAFSGPPRIWFYLMIAIRDTQLEISCLAIDKW